MLLRSSWEGDCDGRYVLMSVVLVVSVLFYVLYLGVQLGKADRVLCVDFEPKCHPVCMLSTIPSKRI